MFVKWDREYLFQQWEKNLVYNKNVLVFSRQRRIIIGWVTLENNTFLFTLSFNNIYGPTFLTLQTVGVPHYPWENMKRQHVPWNRNPNLLPTYMCGWVVRVKNTRPRDSSLSRHVSNFTHFSTDVNTGNSPRTPRTGYVWCPTSTPVVTAVVGDPSRVWPSFRLITHSTPCTYGSSLVGLGLSQHSLSLFRFCSLFLF